MTDDLMLAAKRPGIDLSGIFREKIATNARGLVLDPTTGLYETREGEIDTITSPEEKP